MAQDSKGDRSDEGVMSLSLSDALELARTAQRLGEHADARTMCDRILAIRPENPDALHLSGSLHLHARCLEEAVAAIEQALSHRPGDAELHNTLGHAFLEMGRGDEAASSFRAAIARREHYPDAWSNLGVALKAAGSPRDAEGAYRTAIRQQPTHREAHENLARLLAAQGRHEEARLLEKTAHRLPSRNADTYRRQIVAHIGRQDLGRASDVVRTWLEEEPGNAVARHLLASLSGENVPERGSDAFVTSIFDDFADRFDSTLERLDYRAPALVGDLVARRYGPASGRRVLDAGCGTGLCGPGLRPLASRLTGVDLSAGMLAHAERRACYDELVRGELTDYLSSRPASFDLIVSADTFCYFGDLAPLLKAGFAALAPGGTIVFTVEKDTGADPFRLNATGRYSHRRDHVAAALEAAGFRDVDVAEVPALRQENRKPVPGSLAAARRPGG